jgi:hypothetical protein
MWTEEYPNVSVSLQRTRILPGAPTLVSPMLIQFDGSRFHVRDVDGRHLTDLVADVTSVRGFGLMPRTIEDFLAAAAGTRREPLDIYGDRRTGVGWVCQGEREPQTFEASALAKVAEQVLLAPVTAGAATANGQIELLGRSATLYRSAIEGQEDGRDFRTEMSLAASGPFVLRREARDAGPSGISVRLEVLQLSEGTVTDAELNPDGVQRPDGTETVLDRYRVDG